MKIKAMATLVVEVDDADVETLDAIDDMLRRMAAIADERRWDERRIRRVILP